MNICSTTYSSPLGTIVIESDGECLTSLRFVDDANIVSAAPVEYAAIFGCIDEAVPHVLVLAQAIHWLDEYFTGKQPRNIPRLNPHGTPFQKKVWTALFTIDYGQTKTYGEIAKMVDCRSAQAVGQAISRNPIAIIIPCHRVICSNGSIGGYAFGVKRKDQLLKTEKILR